MMRSCYKDKKVLEIILVKLKSNLINFNKTFTIFLKSTKNGEENINTVVHTLT